MDEIAVYNKERWEELAASGVQFSRPWLDLTPDLARQRVDPENILQGLTGKDVLCLASGGGQQSAAFAMLGANVTVFDLSETQLQRDRETAVYYGLKLTTLQGDMRDLSAFPENAFDIVWHAHSINFIPDTHSVFAEVARILKKNGFYRVNIHNPYVHGLCDEDWNGQGYPLHLPYIEGEIIYKTPEWDIYNDADGTSRQVVGPREFRHTLTTIVNGLVGQGFIILRVVEETSQTSGAKPGSWDHFMSVTAPYIDFWTCYQPNLLQHKSLSQRQT